MIDRALTVYRRAVGPVGYTPSRQLCTVEDVGEMLCVVLRNGSDILGVYEVVGPPLGNWRLRTLHEVPEELAEG